MDKIKPQNIQAIFKNPMYRFLMVLTIASSLGLQSWRTLFNNFAVDIAHLEGDHIGIIQSAREIPGLLTFLVVYLLLIFKEHRLSALSIILLALGIGATGLFPSFTGLMITTVVMSIGFHYYETTNQSLSLQYFGENTAPQVLGKLRGLGAGSNIIACLFIIIVAPVLAYKYIYLVLGALLLGMGLWGLLQNPADVNILPQRKHMVLRKKYCLFYFLTFMAGARRQIFVTFAAFLMVKKFQYSLLEISILFFINNVIMFFVSPLIGKAILKFGERRLLSLEYSSLIFIFLMYAYTNSKILAAFLYIIDHMVFNFAIAIRTYFQRVADPADIAPSMAVGFTINHIAAVVLPAVGGLLWIISYRIPFIGGAAMSLISLVAVQRIPRRTGVVWG